MYFPKASYLKVLILILLSGPAYNIYSQEIITDTNLYIPILRGSDVQNNLNYALLQAASLGNTVGIDWLMKHGADINSNTSENVTAVMFAVAAGEKEAVKTLLKYDPDLDIISGYNESPLMVAVKAQNFNIAELLLRDSANVNLQDRHGYTALHLAAIYGDFNMVDLLLYYEADVNIKSHDGTTPLMVAAYGAFASITDLMLQNRARVQDTDNDGFNALMLAAQNGDTLIIDMLLGRGADIHAINKYKYDALDLAIRLNQPATVEYLLKKEKIRGQGEERSIDPYSVAMTYRRKEIIDILKANNITGPDKGGFDQVTLTGSGKVCFHDLYTGFSVTAREPEHGMGIFAGFDLKPAWTRVLVKETDNLFYQYMDKSYLVYAGILKEFSLTRNTIKGNWYFTGSLAAGYSFGNELKGTNIKPDSRLRVIPSAGFRYNKNAVNFQIGLEYTNTEFYKIGPVWLRTGISFNLDFNNLRGPAKVIKW
jgi:uncharacterized protein